MFRLLSAVALLMLLCATHAHADRDSTLKQRNARLRLQLDKFLAHGLITQDTTQQETHRMRITHSLCVCVSVYVCLTEMDAEQQDTSLSLVRAMSERELPEVND